MSAPGASARLDPAAVAVIALGGGVGSLLRYGLARAVRPAADGFPIATLITNVLGSLLLGMLIVAVTEVWRPHHLVRPLLGTGLLGGFTTFSTFALEARGLGGGSAASAAGYVAASTIGGVLAAVAGIELVRRLEPRLRIGREHEAVDPDDPDLP